MMTSRAVKIPIEGHSGDVEPVDEQSSADSTSEAVGPDVSDMIENLQQQVEEYKDRWLRAEAAVENERKRAERRVRDRVATERERLLRDFLTVADNLELALDSETSNDILRDGVALTHRELLRFLSGEGVHPMQKVMGEYFDPLYHEAVAAIPSQGEEGKVVEEIRKGYLLDGRPLRPARVIVGRSA
jgi:molecular chaperone GrpE